MRAGGQRLGQLSESFSQALVNLIENLLVIVNVFLIDGLLRVRGNLSTKQVCSLTIELHHLNTDLFDFILAFLSVL